VTRGGDEGSVTGGFRPRGELVSARHALPQESEDLRLPRGHPAAKEIGRKRGAACGQPLDTATIALLVEHRDCVVER
jgi:hypothetical protein